MGTAFSANDHPVYARELNLAEVFQRFYQLSCQLAILAVGNRIRLMGGGGRWSALTASRPRPRSDRDARSWATNGFAVVPARADLMNERGLSSTACSTLLMWSAWSSSGASGTN